jgi:hypothetical protein
MADGEKEKMEVQREEGYCCASLTWMELLLSLKFKSLVAGRCNGDTC